MLVPLALELVPVLGAVGDTPILSTAVIVTGKGRESGIGTGTGTAASLTVNATATGKGRGTRVR